MKIILSIIFFLLTTSSFAATFNGKFIQGSFILGKTEPGSEVFVDKRKVKVASDGFFVFGLSRDRKNDVVITINNKKIIKKVFKREYKIQRIDGLEEKKVTPPEEVYERIKRENKWIGKARAINSDLVFFKKKIYKPIRKRNHYRCLWKSENIKWKTEMASLWYRFCS